MRQSNIALALLTAAVLSACGGSSPSAGEQTHKVQFTRQITFGDSLSDVGSYRVGTVAALGGGKFTINGDNTATNSALTGKNWTELMAAQFGLPAPCAAQTGLNGNAAQGFSVPVVNHSGCFGYAQGGARVTNPVGQGNALTGSALGALTVPVVTQVQNHLDLAGKFTATDIVFVMAGGNDVLVMLGGLSAGATSAGNTAFATALISGLAAGAPNPTTAAQAIGVAFATENAKPTKTTTSLVTAAVTAAVTAGNTSVATAAGYGPIVTAATTAGTNAGAAYATAQGPTLVANMTAAAAELATAVKSKIVANGANYVTVNNLPDIASTPSGRAQSASTRTLIEAMVAAFNTRLAADLASEPKVLVVDVYAVSHDQASNPAPYGLTNVSETACDLTSARNPLGSSLTCTAASLKAGDVSHYSFADDVHPTPFLNLLLARYVSKYMVEKGWI